MSIPKNSPVNDITKVDLHIHAETTVRLNRLIAQRCIQPGHDWAAEVRALAALPPGMARLNHRLAAIHSGLDNNQLLSLNENDAVFVQWLTDALPGACGVFPMDIVRKGVNSVQSLEGHQRSHTGGRG